MPLGLAKNPDATIKPSVCTILSGAHMGRQKTFPHSSIAMLTNASVNPITGASQYTVATSVSICILCFLDNICVRLHCNPPWVDTKDTKNIPTKWKAVPVAAHEDNISGDESNDEYKAP